MGAVSIELNVWTDTLWGRNSFGNELLHSGWPTKLRGTEGPRHALYPATETKPGALRLALFINLEDLPDSAQLAAS